MKDIVEIAKFFVHACVTNFNTSDLLEFTKAFKETQSKIYEEIKFIVNEIEGTKVNKAAIKLLRKEEKKEDAK